MANVVGSLVVKLSAHTAEFETGLKKASAATKQMSREALAMQIYRVNDSVKANVTSIKTFSEHFRSSLGEIYSGGAVDKVVRATDGMERSFAKLAKISIGGRNMSLIQNISRITEGTLGISTAATGVIGAFAGLVYLAKRFGDEIINDKKEAEKLGVAYEQFALANDRLILSKGATEGLVNVAEGGAKVWQILKGSAAELVGNLSYGAGKLIGGFMPNVSLGQSKASIAREDIANAKQAEEAVRQVDNILSSWREKLQDMNRGPFEDMIAKLVKARAGFAEMVAITRASQDAGTRVLSSWVQSSGDAPLNAFQQKIVEIERNYGKLNERTKEGLRLEWSRLAAITQYQQVDSRAAALSRELDASFRDRVESLAEQLQIQKLLQSGIGNREASIIGRQGYDANNAQDQEEVRLARELDAMDKRKSIQEQINSILGNTDPIARYSESLKLLDEGLAIGAIDFNQHRQAIDTLRNGLREQFAQQLRMPGLAPAAEYGSQAAYSAIARAGIGASAKQSQERLIEEQLRKADEQILLQREIAHNTAADGEDL